MCRVVRRGNRMTLWCYGSLLTLLLLLPMLLMCNGWEPFGHQRDLMGHSCHQRCCLGLWYVVAVHWWMCWKIAVLPSCRTPSGVEGLLWLLPWILSNKSGDHKKDEGAYQACAEWRDVDDMVVQIHYLPGKMCSIPGLCHVRVKEWYLPTHPRFDREHFGSYLPIFAW